MNNFDQGFIGRCLEQGTSLTQAQALLKTAQRLLSGDAYSAASEDNLPEQLRVGTLPPTGYTNPNKVMAAQPKVRPIDWAGVGRNVHNAVGGLGQHLANPINATLGTHITGTQAGYGALGLGLLGAGGLVSALYNRRKRMERR